MMFDVCSIWHGLIDGYDRSFINSDGATHSADLYAAFQ
jgi:hypothetical protein